MHNLVNIVGGFDPWIIVACGILLIILDLVFIQTAALIPIGLSVLFLALLNFLCIAPLIQVFLYPVGLFGSFFLQKRLYKFLSNKKVVPCEMHDSDYVGSCGVLKVIEINEDGASSFYKYKRDISVETAPESEITSIVKVLLDDGTSFPAELKNGSPVNGLAVEVLKVVNGTAIVK